jgi:hypothetical protein
LAVLDETQMNEIVAHYNDKISCAVQGIRARREVPREVKTPNDAWRYAPWAFRGPGTEPYLCEIWTEECVETKRLPSPS